MTSPYFGGGSGGGSPYFGGSSKGSSKKDGGIVGALEKGAHYVAKKTELAAHDVKAIPGGVIDLGKGLATHPIKTVEGVGKATLQTVEHPLRDPFMTALTVGGLLSGVGSVAGRAAAVGGALEEGAGAGAVLKAVAKTPGVKPRLLKSGETEVPLHASKNPAVRAVQGGYDKTLQKALDKNPEGKLAAHAQKRIGQSQDETARYQQRLREAPGVALDQAAKKLAKLTKPGEGRLHQAALELTSVNTAPEDAARYHLSQAAKGVEPVRNRAVAKLYQTVGERGLLTKNEHGDMVVNAEKHPDLARADLALAKTQGRGDEILSRYGIRSPEALQAAVDAPGKYRAGATYEKPTPAKQGIESQGLIRHRAYTQRLQNLHDQALERVQRLEFTAADKRRIGQIHEPSDTSVGLRERLVPMERELRKMTTAHNAPATSLLEQRASLNRLARIGNEASKAVGEFNAKAGVNGEVAGLADLQKQIDALTEQIRGTRGVEPKQMTDLRRNVQTIRRQLRQAEAPRSYRAGGDHPYVVTAKGEVVKPIGSARAETLGAALSVAKERLQQMEGAAARRVKRTGIGGGEGARPGRGHVSYASSEKRQPNSPAAASPGPVVGVAKTPITSHANTGYNIEHGKVPENVTTGASRHFKAITRFVNTTERRNAAIKTGSDTRRSTRDVLVKVPGAEHGKLSHEIQEALGKEKPTVDEIHGLNAALEALREDMVPGLADSFSGDARHPVGTSAKDAAESLGLKAPEGYKWVDRNALGDLAKPASGPRGRVARSADNINSAVTAATVYFKIGHVGTRVLTNASTNIIQGSAKPLEIARSLQLWKQLSHEDRVRALAAAGQHGFDAMPHEGTSVASKVATRGAQWWAKHADAPFRFNSIAYEARKAGFDTPAKFKDLLDKLENPHDHNMNAAQAAKVDWVAKRANREGIAYDRLSASEKRFITRAVWFYPWLRGTAGFAFNTLTEHPYKANALGAAGMEGRQAQQKELGDLPSYEGGLFKIAGGNRPLVADFSTFSPFSTPADIANAIARPKELSGFLNPVYGATNQLINGQNQFGGQSQHPVTDALASLLATTPEAQIATAYLHRNQDQSKRMFRTTAGSAALRTLLGPGTPRRLNLTAAHSSAARQRAGR